MNWYCPKAPAYYNLQSCSFEIEGFRYLRAVQWLNQLRYTWHADQYSRQYVYVQEKLTYSTVQYSTERMTIDHFWDSIVTIGNLPIRKSGAMTSILQDAMKGMDDNHDES